MKEFLNNSSCLKDLKEKMNKLKIERTEYLNNKSLMIRKLITTRESGSVDPDNLVENIKEMDRQVEGLEQIIKTSINIATTIIDPVREREKCISNIGRTVELLKIENEIKSLLDKLKNEKSNIENKIHIILEASKLIKLNPSVFDCYRENFLKESQDVLNYLKNSFEEKKMKLIRLCEVEGKINVKDCNGLISEMDRNSILTTKLTNDSSFMDKFFKVIAEYVIKAICKNKLSEYSETLTNLNNLSYEKLREITESVSRNFIVKLFLKISSLINERKSLYYKEFSDYKTIHLLIEKVLLSIEDTTDKLVLVVIKIAEKINKDNNGSELDYLCGEEIIIMSNFEKFKFFIFILLEKITMCGSNSSNSNFQELFKKFNTLIYDLGEKYANTEIKFMKNKLVSLFKEESRSYSQNIEKQIGAKFDELAQSTLGCIDDFFYILKISGGRAISSLNLQLSLAIINNIKSILSDELLELLDTKISAVLIKSDNRGLFSDIKYSCKDEPSISYKFTFPNLFLITCINAIDQSKNNITLLFEELKHLINFEIINSQAFNHKAIVLGVSADEEEKMNESITYFRKSEVELISMTFSDVEALVSRYDEFLHRKLKLSFEFLYPNIKSSVDILNSVNYLIDARTIQNLELTDSFSSKFLEETDKILKQWRTQFSEGGFNKFLLIYSEYINLYIEKSLLMKSFTTYGAIILEKDINKIVNYFQSKVSISIREQFSRLVSMVKVLNFESREELIDYTTKYDDIKLTKNEIEIVRKLKREG